MPRSAAIAQVMGLAQEVTDTAVARDRAAGMSWAEISEQLGVTFATARRRYGTRTAETLARLRTDPADGDPRTPRPQIPERMG